MSDEQYSKDRVEKAKRDGDWLRARCNDVDDEKREAAQHIVDRWPVGAPFFSLQRSVQRLVAEDSQYATGARRLEVELADLNGESNSQGLMPYQDDVCDADRCRRKAVVNSIYCGRHGGSYLTPEDKEKLSTYVRDRTMDATTQALAAILELMNNARSEKVKYDAAKDILDRAGILAPTQIELNVVDKGAQAANELAQRLERMMASRDHLIDSGQADDTIEGIVLPTVEEPVIDGDVIRGEISSPKPDPGTEG